MEYLKSQRCFNLVRDTLGQYTLESAYTMFRTEKLNSPHACTVFKASKAIKSATVVEASLETLKSCK